jgi:signal transduction histidine kinase
MLHGEPAVVPDVYQDDRFPHEPYRATFVKSLAMVPVGAPDAVAALGAYWASQHHATPRELEVLTAIADAMGLALTNARLFDELRGSLAREREARLIAETAVTAKDDFLASIAHELRQPLQAILAAVRLMRARASREQGERCREVVERQVRHMNRLVEDLLEAARIVRGHIQLDRRAIDIRETVRRTVDAVTPLVTERGQILEVSVPDGPLPVQADDVRLQQIVMNLLSNAVKYTDPGGRITVTVAQHEARPSCRSRIRAAESTLTSCRECSISSRVGLSIRQASASVLP